MACLPAEGGPGQDAGRAGHEHPLLPEAVLSSSCGCRRLLGPLLPSHTAVLAACPLPWVKESARTLPPGHLSTVRHSWTWSSERRVKTACVPGSTCLLRRPLTELAPRSHSGWNLGGSLASLAMRLRRRARPGAPAFLLILTAPTWHRVGAGARHCAVVAPVAVGRQESDPRGLGLNRSGNFLGMLWAAVHRAAASNAGNVRREVSR
ncbi:uncharacterized protein LOC115298909 [Suricata suricatta]|uniref:uncharacterized protein LOC115298909 n=1 Tax=Suricata suricatta TaxID=37032 RepID=UPI001155509F|nr:uncharacterized protein LOC115298909 [Suricata suricatta]